MDNDINREINIEQVEFGIDIDNIEYSIEINPRDTFAIELNEQGPQGARGYTGNGIESYELTSTAGLVDTYTITFTDGETTTVDVTNGRGITSITGPVSVGNIDTYTINYNDSTTSTFIVTNGIDGVNPTVTVGTTTTGNPGTNASVINTGTTQDIILDFTIPRGDKGETGEDGADGFSPIATVSKVGDTATISITDINGTTTATISDGADGTDGQDGAAATIAVGTVTTGLPTDPASVTNVGTPNAAIFDFTIPKGDTGDTGATGNGIASITKTGTVGLVDTYTILYTDGTSTTFTVTNGANGTGSVADVWVNGTSVLDGDIAKVIVPTDNLQLTNGAGYITGITSGDVTTALGYTPYNSTNPNGYITASALNGYATETWVGNQGYLTSVPTATASSLGLVKPDGITITVDANGVISGAAQGANKDLSNLSATGEAKFQAPLVSGTNIKTINGQSVLGSGNLQTPYRNIGEIVESTIPLTDAGLHLLDGALINGSGIYSAFVDAIADLVTDYPDLFETEANWQSAVTTYGVCGKFVYDSVANTVRLPKITGIIEGTTDVTALGDLIQAGLPNITLSMDGSDTNTMKHLTGNISSVHIAAGTGGNGVKYNIPTSWGSNSLLGKSNTVQPQTIKCYYYIVIATTTKTDIEVDIDEVTTDLNGKADVDLTNCTKPHIVETYVNGTSWYRVYSDGWCEQGGKVTTGSSVTYLKPFLNTDYTLVASGYTASSNNPQYRQIMPNAYTATGFTGTTSSGVALLWHACGYIS